MAEIQSSLDYLDLARFDLVHNAPMQEVNHTLRQMERAIQHWHEGASGRIPMAVYPLAVVYESVDQRDQKWELYLQKNPHLRGQFSADEWAEEKQAYGIMGNAAHVAVQRYCVFHMVSMQNPVFSHSWDQRLWGGTDTPEARAAFYSGDVEWHEFVLVLNERTVYIYDPSYAPLPPDQPRRNLKTLPLVGTKAYSMIRELRKRNLKVERVLAGGGGNLTGVCRQMSLRWIEGGVREMVTSRENTWAIDRQPFAWERVNFA